VDLCGHATLASAHALWSTERLPWEQPAYFDTRSGRLSAEWTGSQISLDFPAEPVQAREVDPSALGVPVTFSGENRMDWLFEVSDETTVRELQPDLKGLSELGKRGVIVTAPASRPGYDFVSRFFAPAAGVDEDPVTGSAHCALGPYWASRLGQDRVTGFQASPRGGIVRVEVLGDRVRLLGTARTVVEGVLTA
jgi:predicted PhzF superfamily epimerase YddE/YHI9